jgi:hypothetical protein
MPFQGIPMLVGGCCIGGEISLGRIFTCGTLNLFDCNSTSKLFTKTPTLNRLQNDASYRPSQKAIQPRLAKLSIPYIKELPVIFLPSITYKG